MVKYIIQSIKRTSFIPSDQLIQFTLWFIAEEDQNNLNNLNSALSFEYNIQRIQSLIFKTEQVLDGEIEFFLFPEEGIGPSVKVEENSVKEWDDLGSIPTLDFLKVLETYLKEMQEFERVNQLENVSDYSYFTYNNKSAKLKPKDVE